MRLQKNIHTQPTGGQREIAGRGGGWFSKSQIFYKDNTRLNWNFHKGEGVKHKKKTLQWEVSIFSVLFNTFTYHLPEEVSDYGHLNGMSSICWFKNAYLAKLYCQERQRYFCLFSQFVHINNLKLICRAHQLVHEGYKYMFDETLVTVWSAPNYCYRCGNIASILAFSDADTREPKLFKAVPDCDRVIPPRTTTPYFL